MDKQGALELLGTYTAEQWGLVTARQARELGVDAVTLHRLTKARYLDVVRRGVYASTGGPASEFREEQAVWLALNPGVPGWERPLLDPAGGVVSHQSAARLHGLGELLNSRITFTVPRRRDVRDPDVWTKVSALTEADVTVLDGLPVTTVLRMVCDLLEQHVDGSHIATIIREGVQAGKLQLDQLAEHVAPYARRYGARPDDGEELLEKLLSQIGLTTAALTLRPTTPGTAAEFAAVARIAGLLDVPAISRLREQVRSLTEAGHIENPALALKAAELVSALPAGTIESMFANHATFQAALETRELLRNAGVHNPGVASAALAALGAHSESWQEADARRRMAQDSSPSGARRNETAEGDDVEA